MMSPRHRRLGSSLAAGVAAAALIVGAHSPATAAQTSPPFDEPIQMTPDLQAYLQKVVQAWPGIVGASGTSVAVVTPAADGRTPVTTYFTAGQTLQEATPEFTPESISSATRFELGSETKSFTADLLAAMVDAGTVSLSDPVQMYAPAGTVVPVYNGDEGNPITLGDLVTHTAALPDLPANFYAACPQDPGSEVHPKCDNPRPHYTRQLLWEAIDTQTLPWEPGTRFSYSNLGFALLGAILSDTMHPPIDDAPPAFQQALDETFLDALSMDSTFVERGFPGAPFAHPEFAIGGLSWLWDNDNAFTGGGGLVSRADDMSTWVRSHLGYDMGTDAQGVESMKRTLDQVTQVAWWCQDGDPSTCEQPEGGVRVGMAWELHGPAKWNVGADFAFKNGGTAGSASDTALVRDRGVGVTALWNRARGDGTRNAELSPLLLSIIIEYAARSGVAPGPSASPAPSSGALENPGSPTEGQSLAKTGLNTSGILASALGAGALGTLCISWMVRRRRDAS